MVSSGNQSSDDMSNNIISIYQLLHRMAGTSQLRGNVCPCMYRI